MRFGAYETAPQRVHTATGLGFVLSLVLFSCFSRTGFRSGRFSFGHEWAGGGGKSLSFTGVLGQSNAQESHTYRNRSGKTCLFSSDISPLSTKLGNAPKASRLRSILRQCIAHSATDADRQSGRGRCDLFGAEEGIAEEEEDAEDPDEGADFAVPTSAEFDEGEGEQAEAEAGGDAEGEGRGEESEEGGESFAEIVPANAGDGAAHERANENESGSGSVRGNGGDKRRAKHGDEKKRGNDDVAEAGAAASGDSGGAFDVAGDR